MSKTHKENSLPFPNMPFRDQIWRIAFEDGRNPAYLATYNGEITCWSKNAPIELKVYGGLFNVYLQTKLSSRGMAFFSEGFNEIIQS